MSDIELKNVKDVYKNIADHFNHTRHYKWKSVNDFIDLLNKNSIIYDIACGNGRNMEYKGHKFIGLDNCEEFVNICKNKGLDVLQGDMCNLPFNDNSCDALICIASYHHLSTQNRRLNALKEFRRVLKVGGKILITVFSINQPKKTKKKFSNYGDNLVSYNKNGNIYNRYYYLFKIEEIKKLFSTSDLKLKSHKYDCGNEIFVLEK